jgi:hypothetical protein
MPGKEWTLLSLTPALMGVGARDAEQRLQHAWEAGDLHLRGIRSTVPPSRELVEIPASEAWLKLDCRASWMVRLYKRGKTRLPEYTNVQARTADVVRLWQRDSTPVEPPADHEPQGASSAANVPVAEAERVSEKGATLAEAVASWLRRLYPDGRPAMRLKELAERVRKAAGKDLGEFRLTTLRRAMRLLGWTTRQTTPKPAKPSQLSR